MSVTTTERRVNITLEKGVYRPLKRDSFFKEEPNLRNLSDDYRRGFDFVASICKDQKQFDCVMIIFVSQHSFFSLSAFVKFHGQNCKRVFTAKIYRHSFWQIYPSGEGDKVWGFIFKYKSNEKYILSKSQDLKWKL